MALLELLTSGGITGALGAIVGVGEKVLAQHMELRTKKVDYAHVEKMQDLQFEHELRQEANQLRSEEISADKAIWTGSFTHDSSFKNTSQWVDNIRALVRPASIAVGFAATLYDPDTFFPLLMLMVSWYFASRVRINYPK